MTSTVRKSTLPLIGEAAAILIVVLTIENARAGSVTSRPDE